MLKRIVIVLSLFAMLLTLPIVANAEEWGEIDGLSRSYRWGISAMDYNAGKPYLYLLISDDFVTQDVTFATLLKDVYAGEYTDKWPILDWNTSTNASVRFVDVTSATSTVDIILSTIEFNWDTYDLARTFLRNNSNQWSTTDGPYSPGGFTHGNAVYGAIIFNSKSISAGLDVPQTEYIIKHEMGHVLGLGHTNRLDALMREHYVPRPEPAGFVRTHDVQAYDLSVLYSFYPDIQ